MIRQFAINLILIVGITHWGPLSSPAWATDSPDSVVSGFQEVLIEVMKVASESTVRERFDQLAPAVDAAFHMRLMTQIAIGSYWKKTGDKDRKTIIDAFRGMSISTLATLFDGYNGEVFEHQMNTPGPSETILVKTELIKSDKSRIEIAYVTKKFGREWRIIDVVVAGGISELMVRRSEYRTVLKKEGIKGLIGLLNGKSKQLMSELNTN